MNKEKECNEYAKLIDYLTSNNIDFKYKSMFSKNDGINIPSCDNMSVIFNMYSYGYEQGNVEVMGTFYDDVIGNLTCNQVINIINNYEKLKQSMIDCEDARIDNEHVINDVIYNVLITEENKNEQHER